MRWKSVTHVSTRVSVEPYQIRLISVIQHVLNIGSR